MTDDFDLSLAALKTLDCDSEPAALVELKCTEFAALFRYVKYSTQYTHSKEYVHILCCMYRNARNPFYLANETKLLEYSLYPNP